MTKRKLKSLTRCYSERRPPSLSLDVRQDTMNPSSYPPSQRVLHRKWPRLGPYGTFFAMALWIAIMGWLFRDFLTSGDLVVVRFFDRSHPGRNVSAIKARMFLFTLSTALTMSYILMVRYLSDRRRGTTCYVFLLTAAILCLLQFPLLISAFTLLIQYIRSEGFTIKRVLGLIYSVGGFASVVCFFLWLMKPVVEKIKV